MSHRGEQMPQAAIAHTGGTAQLLLPGGGRLWCQDHPRWDHPAPPARRARRARLDPQGHPATRAETASQDQWGLPAPQDLRDPQGHQLKPAMENLSATAAP